MHSFVAEEDSCFFDICLPNYTADSERRITYFNEVAEHMGENNNPNKGKSIIQYHTTPPVMPVGFDIAELGYRGKFEEERLLF